MLVCAGLWGPASASAAACSDYANQAAAQRAADTRDGDGVYCESLPCPCLKPGGSSPDDQSAEPTPRSSCRRIRRTLIVRLDNDRWPLTTDHILDAIRSGERRILHLDCRHADQHRAEATRGIPTRRGFDRDEYPPASREGGRGADVRYVRSSDNRGGGASLGNELRRYCNGQPFRVRVF